MPSYLPPPGKLLLKKPETTGGRLPQLEKDFESGDGAIQADSGRFELGQIPVVERTNFQPGLITAPVKNETDHSLTFAYIIKLRRDREPRDFTDARGFVINDYQAALEDKWITELKKKYPLKINDAVVKTLPH